MNKNQLKKQILEKELQIKKMRLHLNNNDVCECLYNKLILEKAILKKELENLSENNFFKQMVKCGKSLFKKDKLISDYFKS